MLRMTSTSKSARWRTASEMPCGSRARSPASTSLTSQVSSFSPSGQGKRGMYWPASSVKVTSQRSAISSVLSQASGSSRQISRISADDLR